MGVVVSLLALAAVSASEECFVLLLDRSRDRPKLLRGTRSDARPLSQLLAARGARAMCEACVGRWEAFSTGPEAKLAYSATIRDRLDFAAASCDDGSYPLFGGKGSDSSL